MVETQKTDRKGGWEVLHGTYLETSVLFAQSGIGRRSAEAATDSILQEYPVDTIVFLGYGGALAEELKIGSLIICQDLFAEGEAESKYQPDGELVSLAIKAASNLHIPAFAGGCVSLTQAAYSPEQKRASAGNSGAVVADMESYWAGRRAADKGVRFLAVRSISDEVEDPLPHFDRFTGSQGQLELRRGLAHFLLHPTELAMLPRLYRDSRRASKSLTEFFKGFAPILIHESRYEH